MPEMHLLGFHLIALVATNPLFQVLGDVFGPLVDLLRGLLRAIYDVVGNWGISIIILTVIVRIILMPLTFKQYRSAAAMQALQPKIKALQKKYKSDKAALQRETMKLYQEHKVNPFASCLPILLQMPVFICLYYAIQGTPELRSASFLWIPELGKPDPTFVLFVVYIITQMVSTELMLTPETDRQQKIMMRAMPFIFVLFLYKFPSGLFIYWITTNLWTIGQQIIIKKTMPHGEAALAQQKAKPQRGGRVMRAIMQAQETTHAKAGAKSEGGDDDAAADQRERSGSQGGGSGAGAGARRKGGARAGGGRSRKKGGGARGGGSSGGQSGKKSGGGQSGGRRPRRPSGARDGRKPKPSS